MPPLNFHDQQHIKRMFIQEQRINVLFNQFIQRIAPQMRKFTEHTHKNVWMRNKHIENIIDKHLINFKAVLEYEIKTNQGKAWADAALKNDKIVEKYIKGLSLSNVAKEGMFSPNIDALKALQNRIDGGLSLSKRVWNITEQTKGHIELFLESGLATGRSADEISRDVRQLLQKPDKRFRRIRDSEGKLVLSQPMKDYNPGRGVYRSSRMNAIRLAATEVNMGYRMSDSERWKQLDFVLGYEIRRSPNAKPCDVCDALVGTYPKGYIFSGFHPFCICFGIPILMDHDDFADYLIDDVLPKEKYVKDIPKSAQMWADKFIKNNQKKEPLFYKINKKMYAQ